MYNKKMNKAEKIQQLEKMIRRYEDLVAKNKHKLLILKEDYLVCRSCGKLFKDSKQKNKTYILRICSDCYALQGKSLSDHWDKLQKMYSIIGDREIQNLIFICRYCGKRFINFTPFLELEEHFLSHGTKY